MMKENFMMEIKKILLPVDFSEGSLKILQYANYVASICGAEVCIIHVAEWPYSLTGYPPEGQETQFQDFVGQAEKSLAGFIEENRESITEVFSSKVITGNVAESIIAYSADENIDLIVIGTHGRKGFERLLLGSVAEKVVKLASCPVMTVFTFSKENE